MLLFGLVEMANLSRRELMHKIATGGAIFLSGASRVVAGTTDSQKKYSPPRTNEPLDDEIIEEQEKAAICMNIEDEHCTYRTDGNCSGCRVGKDYALFEDKDSKDFS